MYGIYRQVLYYYNPNLITSSQIILLRSDQYVGYSYQLLLQSFLFQHFVTYVCYNFCKLTCWHNLEDTWLQLSSDSVGASTAKCSKVTLALRLVHQFAGTAIRCTYSQKKKLLVRKRESIFYCTQITQLTHTLITINQQAGIIVYNKRFYYLK